MKKSIFLLAFGAIFASANAQDAKPGSGKLFALGTIGYSTQSVTPDDGETTSKGQFTFAPGLGYFVNDNFAIGARLSYSMLLEEDIKGGTTFGLGGFARMYKSLSESNNFYIFGEGAVGYSSIAGQYPDGDTAPKSINSFGIGVAPGFGWYPGKKFAVEFTLPSLFSFTSTSQEDIGDSKTFQLGASTLSQPASLTVLYFLK